MMPKRPIKPAVEHINPSATGLSEEQHQIDKTQEATLDDDIALSPTTPTASKKRRASKQPTTASGASSSAGPSSGVKRTRTNTPWTATEEQRLKSMRDAGNSWSEIAKTFPTRTEGSVKKHWYKVDITHNLESQIHTDDDGRICTMRSLVKMR